MKLKILKRYTSLVERIEIAGRLDARGVEGAKTKGKVTMSHKSSLFLLSEGPIASASIQAQVLAGNLYLQLLFQNSISAQLEMEKDYEILLQGDNLEDIEKKRKELDYADSLLGLNILCSMTDEELES